MKWLVARLLFLPTLGWNVLLGRVLRIRHWWDRVDDHVIIGAMPFGSDVQPLFDEGVRAVVNTCVEYSGPADEYARLGVEQLRIATIDFTPPNLADVRRAVDFMDERIAQGDVVYVHCKAGRARSATVVLCWLVRAKGISAEEAQQRLLEVRPHVHPSLTKRQVVQEFCRDVADAGGREESD